LWLEPARAALRPPSAAPRLDYGRWSWKSGLLAAVRQAAQSGREAAGYYLRLLQSVLQVIEALLSSQESLIKTNRPAPLEPQLLARSLKDAYEKTLPEEVLNHRKRH